MNARTLRTGDEIRAATRERVRRFRRRQRRRERQLLKAYQAGDPARAEALAAPANPAMNQSNP